MTQQEVVDILIKHKKYIQEEFKVEKIGLFGSYAKGTQDAMSDIDIYVEFRHKTFDNLAGLWNYLEEIYNIKVDLFHKHKHNNQTLLCNIQKELIYG